MSNSRPVSSATRANGCLPARLGRGAPLTRRRLAGVFVAAAAGLLLASAKPAAQLPGLPSTTACEREGAAIVGSKPEILGRGRRSPKKVRNVVPAFPELPSGTRGSGIWIGELLLDAGGKVRHIWTIRQPRITPPLPAFNRAILDAVRHWRFEPFIVASRATPLCLTVTVSIHWPGAPKAPAPPNGPVAAGESSDGGPNRVAPIARRWQVDEGCSDMRKLSQLDRCCLSWCSRAMCDSDKPRHGIVG
jgi:hypothetical protein